MKVDPTKSAVENLLALIDASNPSAPDLPNEVTVSNLTIGSFANGGDTQVTLTGTGVQGDYANFSGTVDVTYKRLALSAETTSPSGNPVLITTMTPAVALLALENYYGFIPGELTAPGLTVPSTAGSGTVTLESSGSLIYEDGSVTVNVNWQLANTMMLLHMSGTNGSTAFPDDADHTTVNANTNVAISTTQSKFGNGAAYFDGSTSQLVIANDQITGLGTGDFTVEMWVYPISSSNGDLFQESTNTPNRIPRIRWGVSAGLQISDTSNANTAPTANPMPVNQWVHVAAVRKAGVETLYMNGVAKGSLSNPGSYSGGNLISIGRTGPTYPYYIKAYMNELRVSRIARYSSDFTPPAAPFTLD